MQDEAIMIPNETVSENKLRITRVNDPNLPRFYKSNKKVLDSSVQYAMNVSNPHHLKIFLRSQLEYASEQELNAYMDQFVAAGKVDTQAMARLNYALNR